MEVLEQSPQGREGLESQRSGRKGSERNTEPLLRPGGGGPRLAVCACALVLWQGAAEAWGQASSMKFRRQALAGEVAGGGQCLGWPHLGASAQPVGPQWAEPAGQ